MAASFDDLETVKVEREGNGVTWVYMHRPEKLNAMTPQMRKEMTLVLSELERDPETAVLLLTGSGRAFSAGQDIQRNFREHVDRQIAAGGRPTRETDWRFDQLYYYAKPTIAVVNGWCCGGAFTQLFSCDFAIAAEDAQLCLSEINWGIIPGGLVTKVVAEGVRYRDALYSLLLAEPFSGIQAAEMGFVNFAVPAADLRQSALNLADKIMAKNPATYNAAKQAFKAVWHMDFEQARQFLRAKSAELRLTDPADGRGQGMRGFLDDKSYKPGLRPFPKVTAS